MIKDVKLNYQVEAFQDFRREILCVTGNDVKVFLQGLLTNSIPENLDELSYSALLSPQGKYLADFFIFKSSNNTYYLDVKTDYVDSLIKRLSMYKLRAEVDIVRTGVRVILSKHDLNSSFSDPRVFAMGWRTYIFDEDKLLKLVGWNKEEYDALRVEYCIPETGVELIEDQSYILEAGFERLNGVDFRKGCYVGQEVTARMRHKTKLLKGLVIVSIEGPPVTAGTEIFVMSKPVGSIFTSYENRAIAQLKFKFLENILICGQSKLTFLNNLNNITNNS